MGLAIWVAMLLGILCIQCYFNVAVDSGPFDGVALDQCRIFT